MRAGDKKRYLKTRAAKIERIKRRRNNYVLERNRRKSSYQKSGNYHRSGAGALINGYKDAIEKLMPKNLKFLLTDKSSPFSFKLKMAKSFTSEKIIKIPENFSILANPMESFNTLKEIVRVLIKQEAKNMILDYYSCKETDLLTQIFMDAILKDWDTFSNKCIKVNRGDLIRLRGLGGYNYFVDSIGKMVNSVGSPTVLEIRKSEYENVIPFHLHYYDKKEVDKLILEKIDEGDATELVDYVEKCLKRINKYLTNDAKKSLGDVVGETLNNATTHSSLSSRYVIGYFEDLSAENNDDSSGILNLVIMNFGQSIYEKFKHPLPGEKINHNVKEQMKELSQYYTKRTLFKEKEFHESSLWTLYSLQQGVSIIPDENRGGGSIRFINSFLNLSDKNNVNKSRMYLYSGDTIIEFDGTYQLVDKTDDVGTPFRMMTFNEEGDIKLKPDKRYVRFTDQYFPGTAIYAKLYIHSEIATSNGK